MSILRLAPLNVHKLIKLQHPPLAATPPLTPLMKDGRPRVMYTLLAVPLPTLKVDPTALSPARHALLDLQARIVILIVLGRLRRRPARRRGL